MVAPSDQSDGTPGFAGGLPLPEVRIIEDEIRRIGRRLKAPTPLYYVDDHGRIETACLVISKEGKPRSNMRSAHIVDFSVGGVAVSTTHRFAEKDIVVLFGVPNVSADSVLFGERFQVCNVRRDVPVDEKGHRHYAYGLASLASGHSQLYKAVLDSIFIHYVRSTENDAGSELPWKGAVSNSQSHLDELPDINLLGESPIANGPEDTASAVPPVKPKLTLAGRIMRGLGIR